MKWDSGDAISDLFFLGVTIMGSTTEVATDAVTFYGFYSPLSVEAADKTMLYLGDGNTLCYPSAETMVNAFRAVFKLNVLDGVDLSTLADIVVGKTETTGVSDVSNDERVSIADITTLIDQRVNGGAKVIKGNAGLTLGTSGDNWR